MTPWWDFVQNYERILINKIKDRKERFRIISFEWKNRNAQLVNVNVYYIKELHDKINMLKKRVQELENDNAYLQAINIYY
jgi:hypothetical protein